MINEVGANAGKILMFIQQENLSIREIGEYTNRLSVFRLAIERKQNCLFRKRWFYTYRTQI